MGHGAKPGSTNVTDPTGDLNDGTQPRTVVPTPDVIGLDAGTGGAHMAAPVGDAIVGFAKRKMGHHVGDHECFALADQALKNAGAFSAADFGEVTADADYIWGTQIQLDALQAGDILQFRDYRYDRTIRTDSADGSFREFSDFQERPHHTAVVEQVGEHGAVTVLEQNAPRGSVVHRTQLFFSSTTFKEGSKTTEITVVGNVWFYRPQKKH
jgi:hypothetical protein